MNARSLRPFKFICVPINELLRKRPFGKNSIEKMDYLGMEKTNWEKYPPNHNFKERIQHFLSIIYTFKLCQVIEYSIYLLAD